MKMLADFDFAPFVQKQQEKDKCDMCTFFFLIWLVGHTCGSTATFIILFFLSYQYSNIFLSTKGDEIVNSPPCLAVSTKAMM